MGVGSAGASTAGKGLKANDQMLVSVMHDAASDPNANLSKP